MVGKLITILSKQHSWTVIFHVADIPAKIRFVLVTEAFPLEYESIGKGRWSEYPRNEGMQLRTSLSHFLPRRTTRLSLSLPLSPHLLASCISQFA